jgi:hypothetical protein
MPLTPGKGKKTISKNISEFHKGATFKATEKKFGRKTANKQAVAAALSEARRSGASLPKRGGRTATHKGKKK